MAIISLSIVLLIFFAALIAAWVLVGPEFFSKLISGLKRNAPWLAILIAATLLENILSHVLADRLYLLDMSSSHFLGGVPTWLQAMIPLGIGAPLFGSIYLLVFPLVLVLVPIYLLAMGEDLSFKKYAWSLALAYSLLLLFHLAIRSVRPGLDAGTDIAPLLYSDQLWGSISSDLFSRGNSFPSGHTTITAAVVASLWPIKRARPLLISALALIMVGVLYLGLHWPIDVLIGAVLGTVCAVAVNRRLGKRNGGSSFNRWRPGSR